MPRQARIDTPGALHHIICRGIERRNIFKDNTDRNRFLERLGSVLQKTSTLVLERLETRNFNPVPFLQHPKKPLTMISIMILYENG